MKFSPGDLVWIRTYAKMEKRIPPGEHAAIVVRLYFTGEDGQYYLIDVPSFPARQYEPSALTDMWVANERYLRPRRDDYQQHEGLGSRDKLIEPLNEVWEEVPVPNLSNAVKPGADLTEASLEEMLKQLFQQY